MPQGNEEIIEREIVVVEPKLVRELHPLQFFNADDPMADHDFRPRTVREVVVEPPPVAQPIHPTQAASMPMPPEGMDGSALPPLPPTGTNPSEGQQLRKLTEEDVENARGMIPPAPKHPSQKTPPIE